MKCKKNVVATNERDTRDFPSFSNCILISESSCLRRDPSFPINTPPKDGDRTLSHPLEKEI